MVRVGDKFPNATLWVLRSQGEGKPPMPAPVVVPDLFNGKRVCVFAVPGPFTPGCTKAHAPGFIEAMRSGSFRSKGIDHVYCISTADAFVMAEWSKALGNDTDIVMLSDGNLELTRALDLVLDGTVKGMGFRAKRFAMVVSESGYVVDIEVDDARVDRTAAKYVLSKL